MYIQRTQWGWSLFTEDGGLIASCSGDHLAETLAFYLDGWHDAITVLPGTVEI